jgi:hypothetical protein
MTGLAKLNRLAIGQMVYDVLDEKQILMSGAMSMSTVELEQFTTYTVEPRRSLGSTVFSSLVSHFCTRFG